MNDDKKEIRRTASGRIVETVIDAISGQDLQEQIQAWTQNRPYGTAEWHTDMGRVWTGMKYEKKAE